MSIVYYHFSFYLYLIKGLKHISLYLAGLVIVLHSLLPHQHHDELSSVEHEIQHKEANSLLDYIKLMFHEDIGEGHLEHIVVGQGVDIDVKVDFTMNLDFELAQITIDKRSALNSFEFVSQFFYLIPNSSHFRDGRSLRGPPHA